VNTIVQHVTIVVRSRLLSSSGVLHRPARALPDGYLTYPPT